MRDWHLQSIHLFHWNDLVKIGFHLGSIMNTEIKLTRWEKHFTNNLNRVEANTHSRVLNHFHLRGKPRLKYLQDKGIGN